MQTSSLNDFLRELAVGFKFAKSYPPGHPTMDKIVANTMVQLSKVYTEIPEFSIYFLEKTVIFQDIRIDVSKNLAVLSFIETIKKNDIESLTFLPGITKDDLKNLYEVIGSPKLKIKEYGDAPTMLQAKGTDKIKINAVKFGIQAGTTIQVAREKEQNTGASAETEITASIQKLQETIEKGLSTVTIKEHFDQVIKKVDTLPLDLQTSYHDAIIKILERLPSEHRIELLKDLELKPIVLKLLSTMSEEALVKLIMTRADNNQDVGKILGTVGDDKFSKVLPELKEKIPNIYEYLAQVGILLSEKVTTFFSKEDLKISIKPYYTMLDSPNHQLRKEGLKSLIFLGSRFIKQGQTAIAEEIITRVATALEQESVEEVITYALEPLNELYKIAREFNQEKFCKSILDPFNKVLGRPGLTIAFKKALIKFLGETGDVIILPSLFSFLWEAGLYSDVRAAIIKFGKNAVSEALYTLKEAEDYSLRMKLVDILKNIGKESIEILLNNIDAPEWFLRRNIVAIIGDIGEKDAAPRLVNLLHDPDDRVRVELVKTFAKLGFEQGVKNALLDNSIEVKAEALRSLRKTITVDMIKEYLPLLKEKGDALHSELLKIIGEKKVNEAIPYIKDLVHQLEFRDDTIAQELKELAISTLARLHSSATIQVLEELSHSKDRFLINLVNSALKRIEH